MGCDRNMGLGLGAWVRPVDNQKLHSTKVRKVSDQNRIFNLPSVSLQHNNLALKRHARFNINNLVSVPIIRSPRVVNSTGRNLCFGSMNVRSLSPLKLDELLVEIRDKYIDVIMLCETWHDADSVSIARLRADGFGVVERARPRRGRSVNSLKVNHGGVAIVTNSGIRLSSIDIGVSPTSFECVAGRITVGSSSYTIMVIYRTGEVTPLFFEELSDHLDHISWTTWLLALILY